MEVDDGLSLEMVVVTLFSSFVGQSQHAIYIPTTESGVHIKQTVKVKILQNSLASISSNSSSNFFKLHIKTQVI